ncbi:MAG: hypothetical protein HYZ51_01140 [Candidatus Doudnabacteria bacterium]|nr:hypothetical protein [Candidatus Doudnabacteria bacterium]
MSNSQIASLRLMVASLCVLGLIGWQIAVSIDNHREALTPSPFVSRPLPTDSCFNRSAELWTVEGATLYVCNDFNLVDAIRLPNGERHEVVHSEVEWRKKTRRLLELWTGWPKKECEDGTVSPLAIKPEAFEKDLCVFSNCAGDWSLCSGQYYWLRSDPQVVRYQTELEKKFLELTFQPTQP